jgi:hypothetical protein
MGPAPIPELVSFVKRQIRNAELRVGPERRSDRRHAIVAPVLAQPVDQDLNAVGDPFALVTRDISSKGIGLVHSKSIDQGLLTLQMRLADEDVKLVAEILWCKPLGPFYYAGGRFVSKLSD